VFINYIMNGISEISLSPQIHLNW